MADYVSDYLSKDLPVTQPPAGLLAFIRARVSVTAALASGDTVQFFKLPKGAIVESLSFWGDELDTNASPTLDVEFGHDGDQDAFGAVAPLDMSATPGPTGLRLTAVVQDADAVPLDEERVIEMVVTDNPATGATGDVYLECSYSMEMPGL